MTRRASTFLSSVLLDPAAPGWPARLGIVAFILGDRWLNAQRVSEVEIRSLDALDEYALFQLGVTFALAAWLGLAIGTRCVRRAFDLLFRSPMRWICAYVALAVASALWSEAPLLTAFKACQCAVFLVAAAVAVTGLADFASRVRFLAVSALAYIAVSYVGYAFYTVPEYGLNIVSLHFVVGTVPFLGVLYLVRTTELRSLAIAYWSIVIPFVALETIFTSFVSLVATEAFRVYLRTRAAARYLIPAFPLFGAVFFVLLLPDNPDEMVLGIKTAAEITQGTGRFEVWAFALDVAFWQSPIVGHGFVIGDAIGRTMGVNVALGQLHNAHLSALMNLGIVGAALWLAFLLSAYRAIAAIPHAERRVALATAALAYGFHQMFGGASLSSPLHVVWVSHALFFSMVALEWAEARAARRARAFMAPRARPAPQGAAA